MKSVRWQIVKHVLLQGKGTLWFVSGIVLGLAFSMTVILATMGIMDGYEKTLKKGLRKGQGDLVLTSRRGFVTKESILKVIGHDRGQLSTLITVDGFLLSQGRGRGVRVRAVEPQSFEDVSGLFTPLIRGEILLGKELAKEWKVQKNEDVVLAMGQQGEQSESAPALMTFKYAGSVEHGVFEADSRFVYVQLQDFQDRMGLKSQDINQALLTLPSKDFVQGQDLSRMGQELELDLMGSMRVRPYYFEFSSLIEAVKIEKATISLILQIIVAVSVFNLMALVLYLTETRAREIFLIEALGVSKKELKRIWSLLLFLIWLVAIVLSLPMLLLVQGLLLWLSAWALPGEVYTISRLTLDLGAFDFFIVYASGLLWIGTLFMFIFWRLKKMNIIDHLRREFA